MSPFSLGSQVPTAKSVSAGDYTSYKKYCTVALYLMEKIIKADGLLLLTANKCNILFSLYYELGKIMPITFENSCYSRKKISENIMWKSRCPKFSSDTIFKRMCSDNLVNSNYIYKY